METEFSKRLKSAMDKNNITLTELSNKTGIGKSSISDWISGKYKAKQDNVFLLAQALGVNESWLMGRSEGKLKGINTTGETIKKYREKNNLTMKELGDKIGASESSISMYESGKSFPRRGKITLLSQVLGVPPEIIVFGEDNKGESARIEIERVESIMGQSENIEKETVKAISMINEDLRFTDCSIEEVPEKIKKMFPNNNFVLVKERKRNYLINTDYIEMIIV